MSSNVFAQLLNDPKGSFVSDPAKANVQPGSDFELGDFAIDDYRPVKIIAIGAGMSGILASIR